MAGILVTGGAGFIGSHTCKALRESGFEPITFDNLSRGHADSVRWGPFVNGDILDRKALDGALKLYRPEAVIHFAGLAYVGESFQFPLNYYRTNSAGLTTVLEAMAQAGTNNIVFSSSCATYGIPDSLPILETARQVPISPYGRSKLACEYILKDAAAALDLRFVVFRYFNASGADSAGDLAEKHTPETHLIPLAIDAAMGKGPPLEIFGSDYPTSDGTCERDFIHVSDLAEAHVDAVRYLTKGSKSLELNLGSGQARSILQVVSQVERVVGRAVPIRWGARRPGDPPSLYADPAAAQRFLGFRTTRSDLTTVIETAWRSRR
jgi:UDP-arabinose 4-epimerase